MPVVISGGLHDAAAVERRVRALAAAAVMLARGALGNPWIFEEVLGRAERARRPATRSSTRSLWTVDRAEEHWGAERGCRNLRKLYPAYLERLGVRGAGGRRVPARAVSLEHVRGMLAAEREAAPALAA